MQPIELGREVEQRYRRYLETTFYFRDPDLRTSFTQVLSEGRLSRGPFLEGTPVFKRGRTPRQLFPELGLEPEETFLKAVEGDRPLYIHQEEAIRRASEGRNIVVATGTASGKTEAFLYPILAHLYKQSSTQDLGPGVRALVLYPMNALANDQRERLGVICKHLEMEGSTFQFTFGQYIGETPENERDSWRHAQDHLDNRLPGELVLRCEIRKSPPHILLTNYSMLEYLLLRPDDSPLFDGGRARWWTFLVLDEAHQYRGSRGTEMGMLVRRLKQRLREGGAMQPFRCIATSATLAEGGRDKGGVAKFASDLFGEDFDDQDVILGETEPIPSPARVSLSRTDYMTIKGALASENSSPGILPSEAFADMFSRLGIPLPANERLSGITRCLLQADKRSSKLRQLITGTPTEVEDIAHTLFDDLPTSERMGALSELVELLLHTKDVKSGAPLLSARYHLFLRSLEGAFVSYWPNKRVFLERGGQQGQGAVFEVALCRECGQHYFVGRYKNGKLQEAIRDPGDPRFGATFFRPLDINEGEKATEEGEDEPSTANILHLCLKCGAMCKVGEAGFGDDQRCDHSHSLSIEQQEEAEEREDQVPRCSACGYRGPDPVREVIHGTDGPHAVICTTLYQMQPPTRRKKILAFADGRQEAAFFAWYLESSYADILNRHLILKAIRQLDHHTPEGVSLTELVFPLRDLYREEQVFPPATGDLQIRREAWLRLYREFLTDEPRISLEGVGLVAWNTRWPEQLTLPQVLLRPPWSFSEPEAWVLLSLLTNFMRVDKAVELSTENGVSIVWEDLGIQVRQRSVRIGPPKK